jgi:hypothetical protein
MVCRKSLSQFPGINPIFPVSQIPSLACFLLFRLLKNNLQTL